MSIGIWNVEKLKHISERKKKRMGCAVQEEVDVNEDEKEHMFSGDEESDDPEDNEEMLGI